MIGDPNQLPPIGRGRVFADTIEWLKKEHPDNVGTLTDNIRQLVNTVEDKGHGILDLAELFIQENQQTEDEEKSAKLKVRREKLFENIVENGNGDVDKDLEDRKITIYYPYLPYISNDFNSGSTLFLYGYDSSDSYMLGGSGIEIARKTLTTTVDNNWGKVYTLNF